MSAKRPMKHLMTQLRLCVAEMLIGLVLRIIPDDSDNAAHFLIAMNYYYSKNLSRYVNGKRNNSEVE